MLVLFPCAASALGAYRIFPVAAGADGQVVFTLEMEEAGRVNVAGNFNDWSADRLSAKRDELGAWSCSISLQPGAYEYKFVINGKEWIPGENIRFEVVKSPDGWSIRGGEGVHQRVKKRSNLRINERVFIKGLYTFLLTESLSMPGGRAASRLYMNRHIVELYPEFYINDNVRLEAGLGLDSDKAPFFYMERGRLDLVAGGTVLTLYSHWRAFPFQDPLGSLDQVNYYYSFYPVFSRPILLYNEPDESRSLGQNSRGFLFQADLSGFDLQAGYSRFNFSNISFGSLLLKKRLAPAEIALLGTLAKTKLEGDSYIEPTATSWVRDPLDSGTYLQIDRDLLYHQSPEQDLSKLGGVFHIGLGPLSLFAEYLAKRKTGGFFARSLLSNGQDLPRDYINYPGSSGSYHYPKHVYFYLSSYTGEEFIAGIQFIRKKSFQQELSYGVNTVRFDSIPVYDLSHVAPEISSVHSVTRLAFAPGDTVLEMKNRVRYSVKTSRAGHFGYYHFFEGNPFAFDEQNFYARNLASCFGRGTLENEMLLPLSGRLELANALRYNRYSQKDVYFGEEREYASETLEDLLSAKCGISAPLEAFFSIRIKYYDVREYVEKGVLLSFRKTYLNPFVRFKYSFYRNFSLALEYGLDPVPDERHMTGLAYYLYANSDRNFPFFKTAENALARQNFISLRGEVAF